jgi:hypothetical protein
MRFANAIFEKGPKTKKVEFEDEFEFDGSTDKASVKNGAKIRVVYGEICREAATVVSPGVLTLGNNVI